MSALDALLEEHIAEAQAEAVEAEQVARGCTDPERRAFIRQVFFVFIERGHDIDTAWTLAYGAWQRKPEDC